MIRVKRLWVKLLFASLLPTAIIVAGIGWLAYRAARVSLEEQLGESLIAVARQAANLVARPWTLQLVPGDEQSRTYRNLREKLGDLKAAAQVRQIYLFDRQEKALVDSDGSFPIGDPVAKLAADRLELGRVFLGADEASVLFAGKDGRLYKTGFSPVRIDGEIVAVVGVDGSARFFEPLYSLGQTIFLVGAVALILVVLVSLIVSRGITLPLGRLVEAAKNIGAGHLDQEIRVETHDEIGLLSQTLNEMRRSIEERDQQLQMMLSGIAHEVRNPLGGITLFAGLLQEELADRPTALQHLKRINTELDYLSRVVNDFLDFARKRPLEITEIDPRTDMEQIQHLLESESKRMGVAIILEISTHLKTVSWDRERMRRAILNLMQNAIQASSAGKEVRVSLEKQKGLVVLAVADQGSGIPPERKEKIFQPFFTTRQQGTGLGLALAKKIIEAHGGAIGFASSPNQGTTFEIRLPQNPAMPGVEEV